MTNLLFVCARNKLRSPTAEQMFVKSSRYNAMSAGVNPDAVHRVDLDTIEWADIIFVMEPKHLQKMNIMFSAFMKDKRIMILNIPDDYEYMDEDLIKILEVKLSQYLDLTTE